MPDLSHDANALYRRLTETVNVAADRGIDAGDALQGVAAFVANFMLKQPPHVRQVFNGMIHEHFFDLLGHDAGKKIVLPN